MTRTFQSRNEHQFKDAQRVPVTQRPVAVYYRQSTAAQIGNVSTSIQTIDMVEEMKRRGWSDDNIILLDMDAGVSGTKRIDERAGMTKLYELITDGIIGAVACQDEDRLFRDVTQIEVNKFIEACRVANVQVITPYYTYEFAHQQRGTADIRNFRFKCDMGAEYINSYVRGRLGAARQRIAQEGKWTGSKMAVGYMADLRKILPDGSPNPNHRKFIPFEPYADVVKHYFRIFLETGGRVRATMQRIQKERISFPDCSPPAGFKVNYQLKRREGGFYLGRSATVALLTNPVYAGHWMFRGEVIRWNNHEPIISTDDFMRAFNHLSKHSLTGGTNLDYRPLYRREHTDLDAKRSTERPLCTGLIGSRVDGQWHRASAVWETKNKTYVYHLNAGNNFDGMTTLWARRSDWIDRAIVSATKQRLKATFNHTAWEETINNRATIVEQQRKLKQQQLTNLQTAMQNLVANLEMITVPSFVQSAQERYRSMELEQGRLEAEIATLNDDKRHQVSLEKARVLFEKAIGSWKHIDHDERRQILAMLVDRVEASNFNRSGDMTLCVHWHDSSSTVVELGRKPSRSAHWDIEARDQLYRLIDRGADQLEIGRTFPGLMWYQIWREIKKYRGTVVFSPLYYGKKTTYEEYMRSGKKKPIATMLPWTDEDITKLRKMVDVGTTQEELMRAFPHRRWRHLQQYIKNLYGRRMPIPLSGIPQSMTYVEWTSENGQEQINPVPVASQETEALSS
jgi:hypothetical protein